MTMQETAIRPTFGYYRQPNGWITISPVTELEEVRYIREGWQSLIQYGRAEMANEYMAEHPFEPLFLRGGAKELPLQQVLELGFGINPPLLPRCGHRIDQFHKKHDQSCWAGAQPVIFPQLAGVNPTPFICPVCAKELPTVKARDKHEQVMHKEEKGNIRTGETLARALAEALNPNGHISATATEQLSGQEEHTALLEEIEHLKRELASAKRPVRRAKRVARSG